MTECKQKKNYVLMLNWIILNRIIFTFNYVVVLDINETI